MNEPGSITMDKIEDQEPSITALIAAGQIKEDDDTLGIIQNISREHAHSIAKWLVLATGGPVLLRRIGVLSGDEEIRYTPEQVRPTIQRQPQHNDQQPDGYPRFVNRCPQCHMGTSDNGQESYCPYENCRWRNPA